MPDTLLWIATENGRAVLRLSSPLMLVVLTFAALGLYVCVSTVHDWFAETRERVVKWVHRKAWRKAQVTR